MVGRQWGVRGEVEKDGEMASEVGKHGEWPDDEWAGDVGRQCRVCNFSQGWERDLKVRWGIKTNGNILYTTVYTNAANTMRVWILYETIQ